MTRDNRANPPVELTDYNDVDVPMGWKLKDYPLHSQEWRLAFLERVAEVGYIGLIEASTRVYDCLNEPRALRCALIANLSGVIGSGKLAIFNSLTCFLDDFLTIPPLPPRRADESVEHRHSTVMKEWQNERQREEAVLERFAWILDGREPDRTPFAD